MSVTSDCKVDQSLSRNSSEFYCTEEELYDSFMEIVNDPELQGNSSNQSGISSDSQTHNNSGNCNNMSEKTVGDSSVTIEENLDKSNMAACDSGSKEHSDQVMLEDDRSDKVSNKPESCEENIDLNNQLQECSNVQTNGNATQNDLNDSTDGNVQSEKYEHDADLATNAQENPKPALVDSTDKENNISISNTEASNQSETMDHGSDSGVERSSLASVQAPVSPSKADVVSSILVPQPSTKKKAKDGASTSTQPPTKSPSKADIVSSIILQKPYENGEGSRSDQPSSTCSESASPANQSEDISPTNQNEDVSPTNQNEDVSPSNHSGEDAPTNQDRDGEDAPTNQDRDGEDGPTNQSALQSIENDIEEGIRKANEVCEELNLITQRLSRSSDELLDDNDGEVSQNKNKGSTDETKINKADVTGNEMDRPSSLPKLVVTSNSKSSEAGVSSDSTTPSSVGTTPSPTVPLGSSPTHVVHLHEPLDRKPSVSDSMGSSGGSSGDAKSLRASPSPTQDGGPINWEILNTAFDNPETDDDDVVYATSGHYGGFGLVLDDDDDETLTTPANDDDVRLRSVSQSTTMSEVEFQEEYRKSHSAASLERNPDGSLCSGYLFKLGGTGITPKNWRKRWCMVRQDRCLYYYKSARDKLPCGIIVLASYIVSHSSEHNKKYCIKLSKGGGRTYFFSSDSSKDMLRWMEALRNAAENKDEGTSFVIRNEIIHNVAIPALSIKKPDCHGFLTKQGAKSRRSWKRRYCVLKNGCLYYYREMADTTALGVAKLHGYTVDEVSSGNGRRNGFRCIPPQTGMRTFSFIADNEYDKKRWIPCFRESISANTSSQ
ncbi:guanine exchange factor for Rac 30-like [Dendronephthya gigantea]|uniref:guanine exchange factor for Rac 30-like n=1 Tax=Dendronephthya gigantea TaxID=151771 RepID=UPI00106971B0|nr:guanine exchange factor for Rac 30-like [Dendronephthya gigantea]